MRIRELLEKLYYYLNQFRLNWGVDFLRIADRELWLGKPIDGDAECGRKLLEINSRLMSGWYMMEVQIRASSARMNGVAYTGRARAPSKVRAFAFPIISGRMSKRILYLPAKGEGVGLDLPSSIARENFLHFRLVRVSRRFARGRMLRKLLDMHPRYKRQSWKPYCEETIVEGGLVTSQSAVWQDYCSLFESGNPLQSYSYWRNEFDTLTDRGRSIIRERVERFDRRPQLTLVMPVCFEQSKWLEEAIEAVRNQLYSNWELYICFAGEEFCLVSARLKDYEKIDSRIKLVIRETTLSMKESFNHVLAIAQGDWIAIVDGADILSEHALFWVSDTIIKRPEVRLIYSDLDMVDQLGTRCAPYFKSDWNLDLFYSHDFISRLAVYCIDLVRDVGGMRCGLEDAQEFDLSLRCIERISSNQIYHIPRLLYSRRLFESRSGGGIYPSRCVTVDGQRALNEHFQRQSVGASAEMASNNFRVRYALPGNPPLVTVIILTRNEVGLLSRCVDSILTKTRYDNYEILIVDNGSDDSAALLYLAGLHTVPRIKVLRDDRDFNFSALNNAAVKLAGGEVIALLNNDVEVKSQDWLSEMLSHALRPDVGVVGARLWYPDDTLQHGGMILGLNGIAGHAHRYLPHGENGYYGRAALIQAFSAITGACLVVRKRIYEALGGLNEKELCVACSDVDFCLRVREAGYRNIWTPYAELYHHESATRGFDDTPEKLARSEKEIAYMQRRWGKFLLNDPAYSPNLTLDSEDFGLAWPPRVESIFPDHMEKTAAS